MVLPTETNPESLKDIEEDKISETAKQESIRYLNPGDNNDGYRSMNICFCINSNRIKILFASVSIVLALLSIFLLIDSRKGSLEPPSHESIHPNNEEEISSTKETTFISFYFNSAVYADSLSSFKNIEEDFPPILVEALEGVAADFKDYKVTVNRIRPGSIILDTSIISKDGFKSFLFEAGRTTLLANELQQVLKNNLLLEILGESVIVESTPGGNTTVDFGTTSSPVRSPTLAPVVTTPPGKMENPTTDPTKSPTARPYIVNITEVPSRSPTIKLFSSVSPSMESRVPTGFPIPFPSKLPSQKPTTLPVSQPTQIPIVKQASNIPTYLPTTPYPSMFPTRKPTEMPSVSPTQYPTGYPTTASPTHFPTSSPTPSPITLSPTYFPTVIPTQNPTTSSPTKTPTPNPVNLADRAVYECASEARVFDTLIFSFLHDDNLEDINHDTEGYLKSQFSKISKILKHNLNSFRSSHSSNTLSQLGFLYGKYPHDKTRDMLRDKNYQLNLYSILQRCGFQVAHFGLWHLPEELLLQLSISKSFISNDPLLVKNEVDQFLNQPNTMSSPTSPTAIFIWWPRVDIYNNLGGDFNHIYFTNQKLIYGVSGVSDRFGDVCKDIIREDDDLALYKSLNGETRRYDICSRQLHIVNEKIIYEFVLEILDHATTKIKQNKLNAFAVLTSTNGPISYTQDPTQESKTSYRGYKNTLYEGGIRVPFYYNTFINHRKTELSEYNLDSKNGFEARTALNAVDLLPTLLTLSGIDFNLVLGQHFDGENIFQFLRKANRKAVPRRRLQVYHNPYSLKDSCLSDSPQFAVIDNYGRYKLLVEPLPRSITLPNELNTLKNVEMYDLFYSNYETINWKGAQTTSNTFSNNLQFVANSLYDYLLSYIRDNDINILPINEESGCRNIFNEAPEVVSPTATNRKSYTNGELNGIIVLLTDDMGHADASIYSKIQKGPRSRKSSFFMADTPNIDRIAESGGFVFTDFYSNSAVCSPSRAALLTSKYPSHVFNRFHSAIPQDLELTDKKGVVSYLGEDREFEHFNMNNFFKSQGYVTGHFGKWHLGATGKHVDDPMYGLDQYQVYAAQPFPLDKKRMSFETSRDSTKIYNVEFDNSDLLFPSHSTDLIINRTIDFIAERSRYGEKFLVNVWLQSAHAPLNLDTKEDQVLKFNYSLSKNKLSSMERTWKHGRLETGLEVYRTLLAAQDAAVGRLLDYMEAQSILDTTAIFYSSDNGAETLDKYFHSVGNTFSHFRGYKRSLYEGGIRVPGLFRFGGFRKNAKTVVIKQPASLMDLFPTFVGLAGLSAELNNTLAKKSAENVNFPPSAFDLQGRDLSCFLKQGQVCSMEPSFKSEALIFEWRETNSGGDCLGWSARFAVRYREFKLHLEPSSRTRRNLRKNKELSDEYSRIELYNVVVDPAEMTNLWITQQANSTIVDLVTKLVDSLADYTQTESYDTSLFPSGRKENHDLSSGKFPVGYLCQPELVIGVGSSQPWISSSYLKDFI